MKNIRISFYGDDDYVSGIEVVMMVVLMVIVYGGYHGGDGDGVSEDYGDGTCGYVANSQENVHFTYKKTSHQDTRTDHWTNLFFHLDHKLLLLVHHYNYSLLAHLLPEVLGLSPCMVV